jgi:hypothetical protein
MITSLRDKPSGEDELTSKAVPATMYIGKRLRAYFLILWCQYLMSHQVVQTLLVLYSRQSKSSNTQGIR